MKYIYVVAVTGVRTADKELYGKCIHDLTSHDYDCAVKKSEFQDFIMNLKRFTIDTCSNILIRIPIINNTHLFIDRGIVFKVDTDKEFDPTSLISE